MSIDCATAAITKVASPFGNYLPIMSLLKTNSWYRCYPQGTGSIYPRKFPTNSRSIYHFTNRPIYQTQSTTNHSIFNLSPFTHLTQSRFASSSSKRTASTTTKPKNPINEWNLSHRSRATLRNLGYWSPRLVIIGWFASVVLAGLYLLKKSIDTDGFSTQFSPGRSQTFDSTNTHHIQSLINRNWR